MVLQYTVFQQQFAVQAIISISTRFGVLKFIVYVLAKIHTFQKVLDLVSWWHRMHIPNKSQFSTVRINFVQQLKQDCTLSDRKNDLIV